MSRADTLKLNESNVFICKNCGMCVTQGGAGTANRNHCPVCLWSRHVDLRTGDRMSVCRGMMEPVGIWVKRDGEWSLLHRCTNCGMIRANRIAGDDSEAELRAIAMRPVMAEVFGFGDATPETLKSKRKEQRCRSMKN